MRVASSFNPFCIVFSSIGQGKRVHSHFENPKHQRRRQTQGYVRFESHQGYRKKILKPHPQNRPNRSQQKVSHSSKLTVFIELVSLPNKKSKRLTISSLNQLVRKFSRYDRGFLTFFVDYNIPKWFLNRQRDIRDGNWTQLISNNLDTKLREDLERMKKIRCHRGLRHFWGLKVRGQKTKSTGRTGRTLGVTKKK